MLIELLEKQEGKTLEFKENTQPLDAIIRTIVAFANTAGGTIIIGLKDKTTELVGISNPLLEEERLANSISASIQPLLRPDIEVHTVRNKELIVIHVPHATGPHYLKSLGPEKGTYVRLGSTNRVADFETLDSLRKLAKNIYFDEIPYIQGDRDLLNWHLIEQTFKHVGKSIDNHKCESLGILSGNKNGKLYPSYGGILLFGIDRLSFFPDSLIRCARFLGVNKSKIHDQAEFSESLPLVIDPIIKFIERNTSLSSIIGRIERIDVPEYPPIAVREAVINAIIHTDYAMKGSFINIAIFDDRIEFTNPGALIFGLTLEHALAGASKLRNRVLPRVFRELKLVENWGIGLQNIKEACEKQGLKSPKFEELGNQFRLTLYSARYYEPVLEPWQKQFIDYLREKESSTTQNAALLWGVTKRTARDRLRMLSNLGLIKRIGTSPKDPYAIFVLVSK